MTTSQSYIAYAPFGVGLACAVVYFERGADVVGWWIGARNSDYSSAFFKLEAFFSARAPRFYATDGTDLYGGWRFLYSARSPALDKPLPVEDEVCHELDRIQGVFVAEWLFFDDDADAAAEREAYEKASLPLQHVNIRRKRLNKLDLGRPMAIYRSHDFNLRVIEYLQRYWPLDYRSS